MRITIIVKLLSVLLPFTFARSWTTNDKCPKTIKTTINCTSCEDAIGQPSCTSEPELDTMDAIHAALSNCPDISSLDLRVLEDGYDSKPDWCGFPFNPSGGDKYPNLTTLRLEGYDFDMPRQIREKYLATTWLQRISQAIVPKPTSHKSHFDLWLDAMSWSSIEELKLVSDEITDEVLAKLPPRLTSLRKLETSKVPFITALPKNTLTHLKFFGDAETAKLHSILEHHGSSLQSLDLRRLTDMDQVFFTDFNVSVLPSMARSLSHLAVDVPSYGAWPLDTLRIIASLPQLQSADIYTNIRCERPPQRDPAAMDTHDCEGEGRLQRPFVGKQGAEEMFAHMRREKQGLALSNVAFWMRGWERMKNRPWQWPELLERKRAKVVCSAEGDEERDEGWCVVEAEDEREDERETNDRYLYRFEFWPDGEFLGRAAQ